MQQWLSICTEYVALCFNLKADVCKWWARSLFEFLPIHKESSSVIKIHQRTKSILVPSNTISLDINGSKDKRKSRINSKILFSACIGILNIKWIERLKIQFDSVFIKSSSSSSSSFIIKLFRWVLLLLSNWK